MLQNSFANKIKKNISDQICLYFSTHPGSISHNCRCWHVQDDKNGLTSCIGSTPQLSIRNLLIFLFFLKKNWANPGLFFVYFRSFQTNNIIFTTNECEKCHVHPVSSAGIRTHDLLEHESTPITTRPGLPPFKQIICNSFCGS